MFYKKVTFIQFKVINNFKSSVKIFTVAKFARNTKPPVILITILEVSVLLLD